MNIDARRLVQFKDVKFHGSFFIGLNGYTQMICIMAQEGIYNAHDHQTGELVWLDWSTQGEAYEEDILKPAKKESDIV